MHWKSFWHRPIQYSQVYIRKSSEKQLRTEVSSYEKKALVLCRRYIRDENTRLSICPKTWKRFGVSESPKFRFIIKMDERGFSIDLFGKEVRNIPISEHSYMKLLKVFDAHASQQREELEAMIRGSAIDSFDSMYNEYFKEYESFDI